MTKRLSAFYALFLFHFLIVFSGYAASTAKDLPEIHLLIDVSGSMKHTDPQNLRVTAVKLFNYLVNNRAVVSVSTFSNDLEQIIPPQIVTAKFQEIFLKKRKKIKSDGAWTNIDAALNGVNKSWSKNKKVIILLTDGMLDLGSDALNKKSTQQLNETTIPILQKEHIQVYTIGLSNQADSTLLSNISLKTNALFQPVISAKDLDNALYTIFSSVISVQEAPIMTKQAQESVTDAKPVQKNSSNTVDKEATSTIFIDKSIQQFTLIFKKNVDPHSTAMYLSSPSGIKRDLNMDNENSISIGNYKILNIDQPTPGNWILSGPSMKLKQVIILTNVNLITNFSSGVYFNDELLPLSGHLEEEDKLIDSDVLLDTMNMSFELEGGNKPFSYKIPYLGKGVFKLEILLQVPNGNYVAKWVAKSKFLSRKRQFTMSVQSDPFQYTFNLDHSLKIELITPQVIDPDSVKVTIKYQNKSIDVPISRNKNVWNADLVSLCQEPSFSLNDVLIRINARLLSGRSAEFNVSTHSDFCSSEQLTSQLPTINLKSAGNIEVKKTPSVNKLKTIKPEEGDSKFNNLIFLICILLFILILSFSFMIIRINYRKKIKKIRDQTL